MTASTYSGPTALCAHSMDLMATGSREDFERVFHPQAVNREAATEPPTARQPGPAGFYATAQWLRAAFSGLRFEIHQAIEHDDLVAFHVTMSGRHTGDFVTSSRTPPPWTPPCHPPGRHSPSPRPTGSAPRTA